MVDIKVDVKAVLAALEKFPKDLAAEMSFALETHGDFIGRHFERSRFGVNTPPYRRNPSSKRLRSRTSALRRSYRSRVVKAQGGGKPLDLTLRATVGNSRTAKYARLQEYGGTINAKAGGWLTIPLKANYTAAGRVRFASAAALRTRKDVKTFLRKSKAGNLIIFRAFKDEGRDPVPLFILKKSVKVPPRLNFRKILAEPRAVSDREKRITNAVRSARATFRSRARVAA